jgi:hypothetical protein
MLEHAPEPLPVIGDWHRALKVGGFIAAVVPHQFLYEKRRDLPSNWNPDHKRFYTPARLLAEFEQALQPNSYRARHLADKDDGYNYALDPGVHADGCYEIELVVALLSSLAV